MDTLGCNVCHYVLHLPLNHIIIDDIIKLVVESAEWIDLLPDSDVELLFFIFYEHSNTVHITVLIIEELPPLLLVLN